MQRPKVFFSQWHFLVALQPEEDLKQWLGDGSLSAIFNPLSHLTIFCIYFSEINFFKKQLFLQTALWIPCQWHFRALLQIIQFICIVKPTSLSPYSTKAGRDKKKPQTQPRTANTQKKRQEKQGQKVDHYSRKIFFTRLKKILKPPSSRWSFLESQCKERFKWLQ